jgi:hypothetical protein
VDDHPEIGPIKSGEEAEATHIGAVGVKILDFFEGMRDQLPEELKDAKLIIMLDTEEEGICAATQNFGPSEDIVVNILMHLKVLMHNAGKGMEVMTVEEVMGKMMGGSAN